METKRRKTKEMPTEGEEKEQEGEEQDKKEPPKSKKNNNNTPAPPNTTTADLLSAMEGRPVSIKDAAKSSKVSGKTAYSYTRMCDLMGFVESKGKIGNSVLYQTTEPVLHLKKDKNVVGERLKCFVENYRIEQE